MFAVLVVTGLVLLSTAAVIVIGDMGGMSRRMPTQVPPRRLAVYPLVAGVAALVVGVVGLVIP